MFHQHHSLNIHTHTHRSSAAWPDTSDKEGITYSQANINPHNTEEITNKLDGADRDDVYSLNGHCAPLCAMQEATRRMMYRGAGESNEGSEMQLSGPHFKKAGGRVKEQEDG